jgi:hypothetical protein
MPKDSPLVPILILMSLGGAIALAAMTSRKMFLATEEPRERGENPIAVGTSGKGKKKKKRKTHVQTLLFDLDMFTTAEARRWARSHGYAGEHVDTKTAVHRLRQRDPGDFQKGSFYTISFRPGVQAVIGRLKKGMA